MRSLLSLSLLALALLPASAAVSSFSSAPCDPHYEQLNATTGHCDCREGFSGFGCRMCTASGSLNATSSDICSAKFGSHYSRSRPTGARCPRACGPSSLMGLLTCAAIETHNE
ncbi:hypothetical protein V7S43_016164 [Phytophthora oleae]|uniref:Laminin EGF-like domain-containing protein n=1 Tax=Phytophthora oleae TaxID=2107226 RepID=A0ABD3EZM4_9STRA